MDCGLPAHARREGVCGPATVIPPRVEDPNKFSDGGSEERDVERSVSPRVYHPRRYSLHVLRRRRRVRRWRGATNSACGQEWVNFGRTTHARAWWCGDGPFTRGCGHVDQHDQRARAWLSVTRPNFRGYVHRHHSSRSHARREPYSTPSITLLQSSSDTYLAVSGPSCSTACSPASTTGCGCYPPAPPAAQRRQSTPRCCRR